jgi:ferredoxin
MEGDEEGIERRGGWGPVAIERDAGGAVRGVTFRRCRQVYDADHRFDPRYEDADRCTIPCDTVLLAVGQSPNLDFLEDGGGDIELRGSGWLRVDPRTLATTAEGVFVAGDLAHGTKLLIDAVASGKVAARSVYRHVTGRSLAAEATTAHLALDRYRRERGYEAIRRVPMVTREPSERLSDPDLLVERGYDTTEARREASRCLDCGVTPVFDGTRCVLCGGCVDVCPTRCLKLIALSDIVSSEEVNAAARATLGDQADWSTHSAILKDEDRCIRCALCAMRCPADAITMERVTCSTLWRTV